MSTISTSLELRSINEDEVENIIKSLKKNAACGYVNISTKFVRQLSNQFSPVKTKLINKRSTEKCMFLVASRSTKTI